MKADADAVHHSPGETSPLLPPQASQDDHHHGHAPPETGHKRHHHHLTHAGLLTLLMMVVLLVSLGDQLMETPNTRLLEAVLCYRHWEILDPSKLLHPRAAVGPGAWNGVREMHCKADAVQSALADLKGWQQTFNGFPSLLLALPYGWLADRYGRKPVVLASAVGCILQVIWIQGVVWFWQGFDIRVTWAGTLFTVLGGGSTVLSTMFFVLLSDVCGEAERAGVFMRVGAFNLLASLLMPPLAAWWMRYNPWIPALVGTALMLSSLVLFLWIPETQGYKEKDASQETASYPSATDSSSTPAPPPDLSPAHEPITTDFPLLWLHRLRASTAFLTTDWRVPILILPFLLHLLLSLSATLALQYLSKRYALTLSAATLVMTVRNAVTVALLFLLLPWLSNYITHRFRLSGQRKDLYLARASQLLVTLGWTLVGLAPTVPFVIAALALASLGQGAALLLRSFLTSLLPAQNIAKVYTTISIVDTVGAMVGAPLLAGLFKRGLALGGMWVGLPFYFFGVLAAVCTVVMFAVGLRKGEDEGYEGVGGRDVDDEERVH